MPNQYDEMQGSLQDVSEMDRQIPDATDHRWAFAHGATSDSDKLENLAKIGRVTKHKGKKKHG